eukprot:6852578-Pyramimonas_sp.AAC.1
MAHLRYAAYSRMLIARRTYTKIHGYTEYYRTCNGCEPPTADCSLPAWKKVLHATLAAHADAAARAALADKAQQDFFQLVHPAG